MFAQAAPPGSRLLLLSAPPRAPIRAWATDAPDGKIRVVLINDGNRQRVISLTAPLPAGLAKLERLLAPSIQSQQDVTLGGQTFGSQTRTGRLAGRPITAAVRPVAGTYVVQLPAGSAAMLTLR
jgi:hypothetical protein